MERGVLVLVLAATLAACGGGGGDAGDAGSPEATPADGDMLIIGTPADFDTMFPPSSNSAQAGWAYQQHTAGLKDARAMTDVWEKVNATTPLAALRWNLAHAPGMDRQTLDRLNLAPGASWAESVVGPNGIGTPIALGHPEMVFGPEHYCRGWQPWVCFGCPITDPEDGRVLGGVDITGPARRAHPFAFALTLSIAGSIEQLLTVLGLQRRQDFPKDRLVTLWRWRRHHRTHANRRRVLLHPHNPL